MPNFIAIAGNMGVGKSTLTLKLADRLGWKAFVEPVAQNPYLSDFFQDMERWGFHSQVFFLSHRLRQHCELIKSGNAIQDRSVYENAEVFARNLYKHGKMSEHDWATYKNIYESLIELVAPPSLIIYLHASVPVLVQRIENRGREFEQKVDPEYLGELNELYEEWTTNFKLAPVLRVDTDNINFIEDKEALEKLSQEIMKSIPNQPLPLF
ncbi:MAG: Deoxyguanosine kinase / deoxyadenosine kinase subunit [Parcubacteria group bacterium GW2011_GWC2_39_14]|nr:MAG: Deoxyguanosine kinase / deoxyadenosine kinase subunit [Parcubacteria group bacterium GW2011_GWC2_39_14]